MTSENFIVPALSWDAIGDYASHFLDRLGIGDQPYVPVMDLLEEVLDKRMEMVEFQVGDYAEMEGAEGLTCPSGKFIRLREDVYEAASRGDARARFTVAHEIGHWYLHANNTTLKRSVKGDGVPEFRKSEPQANQFAAELLMPRKFMYRGILRHEIIFRHGVSEEAARHREAYLKRKNLI